MSQESRKIKSSIIAKKFTELSEYNAADAILLYYPFGSEPDITMIIRKTLEDGKKVILPKVTGSVLKLYYVDDIKSQMRMGFYGIMEPDDGICRIAEFSDVGLALIPGICFDKSLNRIGYGGGFYDRLIPLLPQNAKKISICFQEQIVDKIPAEKYDKPVDIIITEKKLYK